MAREQGAGRDLSCHGSHAAADVLTGFGLSFARALGEYGSIVLFGNLPSRRKSRQRSLSCGGSIDYTERSP